ncbi:heparinase II/III domain-containing protein [Mucisphaera calidilacus]|nr:heparinase II/III family protein [Mucisphaera calidilacus]
MLLMLAAFSVAQAQHDPRLLIEDESWSAYRTRVMADDRLTSLRLWMKDEANRMLEQPVSVRELEGIRLLTVARRVLSRVLVLSQTYHLTGDDRYASRAIEEMLAAARFEDWNPDVMLDVATFATALSLGHDWLHDVLTPSQRHEIRQALKTRALDVYPPTDHFLWTSSNNWNQVCLGGLTLTCLILEEEFPDQTAAMMEQARAHWHHGLQSFEPDGVPFEGPGYWSYGASYTAIMFAALQTAKGEDPREHVTEGSRKGATWRLLLDTTSDSWYNFADNIESLRIEPALIWFARHLDRPGVDANTWKLLQDVPAYIERIGPREALRTRLSLALVWSGPGDGAPRPQIPRVMIGDGVVPVTVLQWRDPANPAAHAYVGIKGGKANMPQTHAHMDMGSFIAELRGVRWSVDPGREMYGDVEKHIGHRGMWLFGPGSPRWTLTRYQSLWHSTLTIAGAIQDVNGRAEFTRVGSEKQPFVEMDLTPVYSGQAQTVRRRVEILSPHAIQFTDRLTGVRLGDSVTSIWMTDANVTVETPRRIRLDKQGRTAWLHINQPTRPTISTRRFEDLRQDYERPDPNLVAIDLTSAPDDAGRHAFVLTLSESPQPHHDESD